MVYAGRRGKKIGEVIDSRVHADNCPLCESLLNKDTLKAKDIKRLQEIDQNLSKAKFNLDEAVRNRINRVTQDLKNHVKTHRSNSGIRTF